MKAEHEILLPLDERNIAHVLAALALGGIAAEESSECNDCRCWWVEDGFTLRLPFEQAALFQYADKVVRSLRWVEGLGVDDKLKIASKAHHGLLQRDGETGTNLFLSLVTSGAESSPFKTFSGQVDPVKILSSQLERLQSPKTNSNWLRQRALGANSWGFDSSVGSHAYDLGFGSNEESSGDADPVYPAIELLSLAGAAFFSTPHSWQAGEESFHYFIWHAPLSLSLAPLAAGGSIAGAVGMLYAIATRGAAYGNGAAYRYFPEASPITNHNNP